MFIALKRIWIRLFTTYLSIRRRTMFAVIRHVIADKYLRGEGIEIGALHNPLLVPKGVTVRYVDKWPTPYLKEHYPELKKRRLVHVDIVADGETLSVIQDGSQDFVIANHFLEHCKNPLATVKEMFRVLRDEGVLFISLPDKRYTFDAVRPVTPVEHLLRDYQEGPEWSARGHAEEWVKLVLAVKDESEAENRIRELAEDTRDSTMHYHTWTQDEALDFILALKRKVGLRFETELFFRNGDFEVIFVLRRTGVAS
jgi:predicted SAM-dependent methyltransferase